MTTIPETSLSLLSQLSNSTSPPRSFTEILITIGIVAACLYYASPTRLARALVSALADVENAYLAGVENGIVLSTRMEIAEGLMVLQLEISTLRETSLRCSLSHSPLSFLCDTFNIRRSVAVFRCLAEVHALGTYIEILSESQLREITSASEARCQCPLANRTMISLRRRDRSTPICA